jgi:hypothetical protein
MQVRAASLDRVVRIADLLPGLDSLPRLYRHFSPLQMEIPGIGIVVGAYPTVQFDTMVGKKK